VWLQAEELAPRVSEFASRRQAVIEGHLLLLVERRRVYQQLQRNWLGQREAVTVVVIAAVTEYPAVSFEVAF